jgi:hypothetical protein
LDWFRRKYNGDFDHERFWNLFSWVQKQNSGSTFNATAAQLPLIRFYIDTVANHPEYKRAALKGVVLKIG